MLSDQEKEEFLHKVMSNAAERESLKNITDTEGVFDIDHDPYNHMVKLLFNKWKPYLLRAIAFDDGTYFSKFFKQLPISQKVLSQNLKEMQEDELITRTIIPEVPPRVQYNLTKYGKSLIGLLDLVYDWGWNDMKRKGISVDVLGEMWHGYREKDSELMDQPFSTSKRPKSSK